MSNIDCGACNDLREYAPHFVQNGITSTECTSLQNDTGLNPSLTVTHTDCDDLNDVNDCLVGRMDGELEAYEVCDWKRFMHKFIPNVYETIKGIICAICGLWTNVHDLWTRLISICNLVDSLIVPPVTSTGYYPERPDDTRNVGTIAEKNGNPLITFLPDAEVGYPTQQHFGLHTGIRNSVRCSSGACVSYIWIAPGCYAAKFSADVAIGDIVWYCTKEEAYSKLHFTDYLWQLFSEQSSSWYDYAIGGSHKYAWFNMRVGREGDMGDNYLVIIYIGSSYPNEAPGDNTVSMPQNPYRTFLVVDGCNS